MLSWLNDPDCEELEGALRQFDVDIRFGPCRGMTRLQRYTAALKHGLEPPAWVGEALEEPSVKKICVYDQHIRF